LWEDGESYRQLKRKDVSKFCRQYSHTHTHTHTRHKLIQEELKETLKDLDTALRSLKSQVFDFLIESKIPLEYLSIFDMLNDISD
jgi:uncharacterized FlaG/YvyC family protein